MKISNFESSLSESISLGRHFSRSEPTYEGGVCANGCMDNILTYTDENLEVDLHLKKRNHSPSLYQTACCMIKGFNQLTG